MVGTVHHSQLFPKYQERIMFLIVTLMLCFVGTKSKAVSRDVEVFSPTTLGTTTPSYWERRFAQCEEDRVNYAKHLEHCLDAPKGTPKFYRLLLFFDDAE